MYCSGAIRLCRLPDTKFPSLIRPSAAQLVAYAAVIIFLAHDMSASQELTCCVRVPRA